MGTELVPVRAEPAISAEAASVPALLASGGAAALFAWEEFFQGKHANRHTRKAYRLATERFLAWCEAKGYELLKIRPGQVGEYFHELRVSHATKKQHLAAIRGLFDQLVMRHVLILNPAHAVRLERHQVIEGKTPEIQVEQARTLLRSIDTSHVVGLRDRAIIAILIYTAARVGAVAKLLMKSFEHDGNQWTLRFEEKGGKSREIPVRHDLERFILEYRDAAGLRDAAKESPLFRTTIRKTKTLTANAMTAVDMCRMVKRRMKEAGLPARLSPHSFRVTTITDLLQQGVPLEDVQYLAGHADPRTTRLYDRRQKKVTRNIVERISI
jgi:site-specific recombinase XerD